jgi:hypothetical protein
MKKIHPFHRNTLIAILAAVVVFAGVSYASILQSSQLGAVNEPIAVSDDTITTNYVAGGSQNVDVSVNDTYPNPTGTFITSVIPNGPTIGSAFANPPYNVTYIMPGGYVGPSFTDVFTVTIFDSAAVVTATSQLIVNVTVAPPTTPDTLVLNGPNQVGVGLRIPVSGSIQFGGVSLPPPGNVPTTIAHPSNVTVYTNITGGTPITNFTFTPLVFDNVMFYVQGDAITTSPINIVFTPSASSGITPASHEINVIPGPAAQINVSASPNTVQAGEKSTITVNLQDNAGNNTVLTTPMILNINLLSPMNAYEVGGVTPITFITFPVNVNSIDFEVDSTLIGTYPVDVNLGNLIGSVDINVTAGDPAKLIFRPATDTTPVNVPLNVNIVLQDMYGNDTTSPTPFNVNLSNVPSVGGSFVPDAVVFPANVTEIIAQFIAQTAGEYTEVANAIGMIGAVGQITATGGGTGNACNIPNVNTSGCSGTTTVNKISELTTWMNNPVTNLVVKGGKYDFGNSALNINTDCSVSFFPTDLKATEITIHSGLDISFNAFVKDPVTPLWLSAGNDVIIGPSAKINSTNVNLSGKNVSAAGDINTVNLNICSTNHVTLAPSSKIYVNNGGNATVGALDALYGGKIEGYGFASNVPIFTLDPSNKFNVPQNCFNNGNPTPASFKLKGTCLPNGPAPF